MTEKPESRELGEPTVLAGQQSISGRNSPPDSAEKMTAEQPKAFFDRIVTHDRAREAVNRFCNGHFRRGGKTATASIPANPEDDDIVLVDYIAQQRKLERERDEALEQLKIRRDGLWISAET